MVVRAVQGDPARVGATFAGGELQGCFQGLGMSTAALTSSATGCPAAEARSSQKKTHCIPIPAPALLWDCWSFSRAPGSGELREPGAEMMVPRGSVRCWLGLSPNYGTKWLTHMRHNELTQDLTAASTAWACARFVRAWIALARCCASRGCPAWWKPPSPCVQLLAAEMCSRIPRGTQCLQELGFVGFGGDPMVFLVTNEFFSSP